MKRRNIQSGLTLLAVLSSCGGADSVKAAIASRKGEISDYELTFDTYSRSVHIYEGTERSESSRITIQRNKDGEFFVSSPSGSYENKWYLVNNKEHGRILFHDTYVSPSYSNRYAEAHSLKRDGKEEFDKAVSTALGDAFDMVDTLFDPNRFVEERTELIFKGYVIPVGTTLTSDVEYFSEKEGELTINALDVYQSENSDAAVTYRASYEDFFFKEATVKRRSATPYAGGPYEYHFSLERKEKVSIDLPEVWESYLSENQ